MNTKEYIQISDNSLIPSIENMFDDTEFIFQDGNVSFQSAKRVKTYQKKHSNSVKCPATIQMYGRKKKVHDKAPTCKEQFKKDGSSLMKNVFH